MVFQHSPVVHMVFFEESSLPWTHRCDSFRMQFEKVGCGLLREAKWKEGEWAVLVEAKGKEKNVSV